MQQRRFTDIASQGNAANRYVGNNQVVGILCGKPRAECTILLGAAYDKERVCLPRVIPLRKRYSVIIHAVVQCIMKENALRPRGIHFGFRADILRLQNRLQHFRLQEARISRGFRCPDAHAQRCNGSASFFPLPHVSRKGIRSLKQLRQMIHIILAIERVCTRMDPPFAVLAADQHIRTVKVPAGIRQFLMRQSAQLSETASQCADPPARAVIRELRMINAPRIEKTGIVRRDNPCGICPVGIAMPRYIQRYLRHMPIQIVFTCGCQPRRACRRLLPNAQFKVRTDAGICKKHIFAALEPHRQNRRTDFEKIDYALFLPDLAHRIGSQNQRDVFRFIRIQCKAAAQRDLFPDGNAEIPMRVRIYGFLPEQCARHGKAILQMQRLQGRIGLHPERMYPIGIGCLFHDPAVHSAHLLFRRIAGGRAERTSVSSGSYVRCPNAISAANP